MSAQATTLDFRIDWGYQFLYSRRQYHPVYSWDGRLECSNGTIRKAWQLEYPYCWWGIAHTARETPLPSPEWNSTTRRAMSGVRVVAECSPDAEFTLATEQGNFRFTAEQVLCEGRIVFHVGHKYSHCSVIVTRMGFLWYRPEAKAEELVIEPPQMRRADIVNFSRHEHAWIEPGASVTFDADLQAKRIAGEQNWLLHLHAMTMTDRVDPYSVACDYVPMELRVAGAHGSPLAAVRPLLRFHDMEVQLMQDVWAEFPLSSLPPGHHTLELVNRHETLPLLINRISLRPVTRRHLEVSARRWALVGREFITSVRVLKPTVAVHLEYDESVLRCLDDFQSGRVLLPGRVELRFVALKPATSVQIQVRDDATGECGRAYIDAIYDLPAEQPELKVGYDMTTVPHDNTGTMDWLLDYTHRTQMGNLVCFRAFPIGVHVPGELLERWGRFCRDHRIYAQTINMEPKGLPAAAAEYFHAGGAHELSGATYAHDPEGMLKDQPQTMREAAERFLAFARGHVEKERAAGARKVAFGDASGGHRYSLLAGADFLRAETMVAHTMQHLSQARPAAQALGDGEWGVHIAIQHAMQPYLETHLGQYYLSLLQPWMMGASFIYEEDSLFLLFKEERQCWDDALTRGKRNMTREFFKWASTHPRAGRADVRIGAILGRYAAPFNGFICGCEQDPSYAVWGRFGRNDPTWGHRQPEKFVQVLDVLMPGASTQPLRQKFDRRRFFFSGTPYGDFDQVPVEAGTEFLKRYRLLLHLGWNTMTHDDYAALKEFVSSGGTLFLAVPQLSTHEGREFLDAMSDLELYRGGDVADLCGARLTGRGERYSGKWRTVTPDFAGASSPELSRWPSTSPGEDGPCHLANIELCGARVAIEDVATGQPMLIEHGTGRGRVYLMTVWAYPGHEELSDFSAAVVARLAGMHRGDVYVEDPSREVFWTWWADAVPGCGKLMLLNTDWTTRGNTKPVRVVTPSGSFGATVREREALIIQVLPFGSLIPKGCSPHVEMIRADAASADVRLHGTGSCQFQLYSAAGEGSLSVNFGETTCREITIQALH